MNARQAMTTMYRRTRAAAGGARRAWRRSAEHIAPSHQPVEAAATGSPSSRYHVPAIEDVDLTTNLEWNRQRWGQAAGWSTRDGFGYHWDSGHQQRVGDIARLADVYFRPLVSDRHDLRILELSPGGGRFTAELIRYASEMVLVDMNQACLDLCRDRFAFFPTPIEYISNDGASLSMVAGEFDAIVCYDSMVHMHPDIVAGYVEQMAAKLVDGGFLWLDHSGRGQRDQGHRTDVTDAFVRDLAGRHGLTVESQQFRNDWDCISVLRSVRT